MAIDFVILLHLLKVLNVVDSINANTLVILSFRKILSNLP